MSEPDRYWNQIAGQSGTSRAVDANRDGQFFRDIVNARARNMAKWKLEYDKRRRGSKFLCMLCLKPKLPSQFPAKRGKYIPARCRSCGTRTQRSHRKKLQ